LAHVAATKGVKANPGSKPDRERAMRKVSTRTSGGRFALTADLADIARTFRSLLDPYRPELHYMRGPGPKWRAKHAQPATAVAAPGLMQAKA
jgi:hypothetical protein